MKKKLREKDHPFDSSLNKTSHELYADFIGNVFHDLKKYSNILDVKSDLIFLVSKDCKLLDYYSNGLDFLNVVFDNLINRSILSAFPKDKESILVQAIADCIEFGKRKEFEYSIHTEENGVQVCKVVVKKVNKDDALIFITTITDKIEFENLKRSFLQISNHSSGEIIVFSVQTGEIYNTNFALRENLGYSSLQILKLRIGDIILNEKDLYPQDEKNNNEIVFKGEAVRYDKSTYPVHGVLKNILYCGKDAIILSINDVSVLLEREVERITAVGAIESAVSAIFTATLSGEITYANDSAAEMWGYDSVAEMLLEKPNVMNYWTLEGQVFAGTIIQKLIEIGIYQGEGPIGIRKNGEEFLVEFKAKKINNEEGQMIGITGSFIDVTAKNRAEIKLRKTDRTKILLEQLDVGLERRRNLDDLLEIASQIIKTTIEGSYARLYSYEEDEHILVPYNGEYSKPSLKELEKTFQNSLALIAPKLLEGGFFDKSIKTRSKSLLYKTDDLLKMMSELVVDLDNISHIPPEILLEKVKAKNYCIIPLGTNEKVKFIITAYSDMMLDEADVAEVSYVVVHIKSVFEKFFMNEVMNRMGEDFLKLQETKNALQNANMQKEILLKEIHHRVKNNLQIISSLLSLDSNANEHTLFKTSQNRIKTMSLVHELLYDSQDISSINYQDYLINLSDMLASSYGRKKEIAVTIKAKDIKLNIDTSIPFGLLINELLSNSYKHAFQGMNSGSIYIELKNCGNDLFEMKIGDNGVGCSDKKNDKSLGLELVERLSKQLKGEVVKLDRKRGTHYVVTFEQIHI